jgi:aspartyl aminopeptidase
VCTSSRRFKTLTRTVPDTSNQSSIVAFTVPRHPTRNTGVSIVGGHTDSPVLKLRPISKKQKGGYLLTAVELYGGGIWPSW